MVLGKILEDNLSRALLLSDGDVTTFFASPFSATVLIGAMLVLVGAPLLRAVQASLARRSQSSDGDSITASESQITDSHSKENH